VRKTILHPKPPKPFTGEQFVAAVRELLDRPRSESTYVDN
jgi:hypothetical protein